MRKYFLRQLGQCLWSFKNSLGFQNNIDICFYLILKTKLWTFRRLVFVTFTYLTCFFCRYGLKIVVTFIIELNKKSRLFVKMAHIMQRIKYCDNILSGNTALDIYKIKLKLAFEKLELNQHKPEITYRL